MSEALVDDASDQIVVAWMIGELRQDFKEYKAIYVVYGQLSAFAEKVFLPLASDPVPIKQMTIIYQRLLLVPFNKRVQ